MLVLRQGEKLLNPFESSSARHRRFHICLTKSLGINRALTPISTPKVSENLA